MTQPSRLAPIVAPSTRILRQTALLAALCAVLSAGAPARAQTVPLVGDVDGDLRITVKDAVLTLRIALGLVRATAAQLQAADVSPAPGTQGRPFGDGRVTTADAQEILRRAIGLGGAMWPGGPALTLVPLLRRTFVQGTLTATLGTGFVVKGRVTDTSGRPAAGTIRLYSDLPPLAGEATIASDGSYAIAAPFGAYEVQLITPISGTGYTGQVVQRNVAHLQVNADTALNLVRPNLPTLPLVTGTITSPDGLFAATSVTFRDIDLPNDTRRRRSESTATVTNGSYSLRVPVGQYKVQVTGTVALGGGQRSAPITMLHPELVSVGADRPWPITMPLVLTVTGHVFDSAGNPFKGAGVDAISPFPWGRQVDSAGITDNSGTYRLFVTRDTLSLQVRPNPPASPGGPLLTYLGPQANITTSRTVDLQLPPLPTQTTVSGSVTDPLGRPVAGATVLVQSVSLAGVSPNYRFTAAATTGNDGFFSFQMPQGEYFVAIVPGAGSLPGVISLENQ